MEFHQVTEMLYNSIKKLILIGLFLGLISCGSDKKSEDPETDFDVSGMLINMADNIILPAYAELNTKVEALDASVTSFETDQSTSNLQAMQQAYLDVHMTWHKAAMFDFGPAQDVLLRTTMNTYPVNDTIIRDNITAGKYDLGKVSNFNATGLNALDYLLFGTEKPLSDGQTDYIKAVVAQMKSKMSKTINDWNSYYRDGFVKRLGTASGSSLSLLLNDYSLYTEKNLRTGKIRIPAGLLPTSKGILINHIEGRYSANYSSTYIQESLRAVSDYYYGIGTAGNGLGLDDFLRELDTDYNKTKLHIAFEEQLKKTIDEADKLNNPFSAELQSNPQQVKIVYNHTQDLVILLKNHIIPAVGVLVGYVDTDGD